MSCGTVEREADPVDLSRSRKLREQRAELVAGALRLGRDAPVLRQLGAVVEPEDGLRVADVDCEEHGLAVLEVVVGGERLADLLGERLGGEPRLLALAAQLLDRDVAEVKTSARGMIRVGRFLSQTQTSSIRRWKNG